MLKEGTIHPITLTEDTSINQALKLMRDKKVCRLPVLNGQGELVGIVSEKDLLCMLLLRQRLLCCWPLGWPRLSPVPRCTLEIVATLVSGIAHHQLGNIRKDLVLPLATPSLILAENGQSYELVGSVNLVKFFVTLAEKITFALTIGLEAFRWGIVAALLIAGVVAGPVAAWVCKELPHRTMGTLLNVRTLVLALVK